MSVREKENKKNTCPSRGLGIAAAAIGVGVGAALYYFFNKQTENPSTEGSSSDWTHERPDAFHQLTSDDSYTTISEHDTTDTSMNSDDEGSDMSNFSELTLSDSDDTSSYDVSSSVVLSSDGDMSIQYLGSSDSENDMSNEWDVTSSSIGVPEDSPRSPFMAFLNNIGTRFTQGKELTEEEQMAIIRQQALEEEETKMKAFRQQAYRERSWTLEECSICFDVMLRNQDVTSLPCSHNFHTDCIMPWLQEKQTCPNCRKVAE